MEGKAVYQMELQEVEVSNQMGVFLREEEVVGNYQQGMVREVQEEEENFRKYRAMEVALVLAVVVLRLNLLQLMLVALEVREGHLLAAYLVVTVVAYSSVVVEEEVYLKQNYIVTKMITCVWNILYFTPI